MSRQPPPLSPLSIIRIVNVKKLLSFHNLNQAELANGAGISGGRMRQSFGGGTTSITNPSETTMHAICNYFKLWSGALDVRNFDPEVSAPPGVDITIHIKNLDRKTAAKVKELLTIIKGAV